MTAIDKRGLCLGYALDRAEEITGLRVNDALLIEIAASTIATGMVPDSAPGLRRIQIDDVGEPGDIVILRGGAGLHAVVTVGSGFVEDVDPRGRKRRVPFRRVAWLTHSAWRMTG